MQKPKRSLIYFATILLLISCSKTPFNYRTEYTGKWGLKTVVHSFNLGGPETSSTTTMLDSGKLKFGSNSNELELVIKDSLVAVLEINKDGIISTNNYLRAARFFSSNDSLYLYYYSGGLGGGTSKVIEAYRY